MKDFLEEELHSLRKGTGITLLKLEQLPKLRANIAERTGIETQSLTVDQVQIYLRYEFEKLGEGIEGRATRNAFAIDHEAPGNLTQRRAKLAKQLDCHPDTIEAAENRGIKELIRRLMYSKSPTVAFSPEPRALTGRKKGPERMTQLVRGFVSEGLGELYAIDSHTSELIRCFGRDPHPYMDTSVEWMLTPSEKGDGWYKNKLRYVFRRHKSYFRLAIVSSAQDCKTLMASGLVDELIVVRSEDSTKYAREIKDALQNAYLVVHDAEENIQQTLRFTEVDALTVQQLLSSVWQVDPGTCRMLEVTIPAERQKATTTYEYRIAYNLPINEHYAFWYSPGLMYLHNITVDISRFPGRNRWKFFMIPFFGEVFPGTVEPTGDRFTMPANSWIMQGHGLALTWQHK